MRIFGLTFIAALAACSAQRVTGSGQPIASTNDGEAITVRLSDFAFDPEHLRLKAGVPVRLRLVNDSGGGHDFSAPAFFAASSSLPGSLPPTDGGIEVGSHQTVEIALVPRMAGTYPLECSHFLHSLFGMSGTIEVLAP